MNAIEKYEGITGEELPRRSLRIKNPVRLGLKEFWNMNSNKQIIHDGPNAWGSVQNNPCDLYRHIDGRWIEVYQAFPGGMEIIYIDGGK